MTRDMIEALDSFADASGFDGLISDVGHYWSGHRPDPQHDPDAGQSRLVCRRDPPRHPPRAGRSDKPY
jgi:hypothetical protein